MLRVAVLVEPAELIQERQEEMERKSDYSIWNKVMVEEI